MNVAIFIRKWTCRGGNGNNAVELAKHLVRRGHDVQVYCQTDDNTADIDVKRHRTMRVPVDPTLRMLAFAWSCRRAVSRLRREDPDVVTIGFDHATVCDVYRLGGGVHRVFMKETKDQGGPRPGGPVLDRVALMLERERFRTGNFTTLVSVSDCIKQELIENYQVPADRIAVIRNGVDLTRFHPSGSSAERGKIRRRWGASEREPVMLLVGQNPAMKGFDKACQVAARLGIKLVYVGGTKRGRSHPHAVWDGVRDDVDACYRAADVLILPSRFEAFGNVVLEAAACGLPAISTARMGATEMFRGTILEHLSIVDPSHVEGLSSRVRYALENREHLSLAAIKVAQSATRTAWADAMETVLLGAARPRNTLETGWAHRAAPS